MAFADGAIREVKLLSFIYEMERALQTGVKYIATTWICFA